MTKWTRTKRMTTLVVALTVAMSMLAGPAGAVDPTATAQDTRTSIIAEITSLIPTSDSDADKKLAEAAKKLTESLSGKYWSGPDELGEEGKKVFEKDRDAAKKLREAIEKLTKAGLDQTAVAETLSALVSEDRRLAEAMISAAETAGASGSKIEDARKEMTKAEKELADNKPDDAIDHFKKAWEKAVKAEAEASKDSSTAGSGGGDYSVYTFWFIDTSDPARAPFAVTGTNESGTYGDTGRGNEGYLEVDGVKMQLHVSCSDAFTDGTGDKSDPTEASPFRVVNYTISKYKSGQLDKTCNLIGVPELASVNFEVDYRVFGDGATGEWLSGDGDPVHYTGAQAEEGEYRFTVTNSGSVALSGVTVTPLLDGESCVLTEPLEPGASTECTPGHFFPQIGTNERTATATATYAGGTVSASDSATFVVAGD